MRSFGGEFSRSQKISLSGKSKQAENREEVLQRTRQEREQRKQQKLEHKSATTIQAAWRSHHTRQRARAEMKRQWIDQYGTHAEHATLDDITKNNGLFLSQLCFFADIHLVDDVCLLAKACSLALASTAPTSHTPILCTISSSLAHTIHSQNRNDHFSTPSVHIDDMETDDNNSITNDHYPSWVYPCSLAQKLVSLSLNALALHTHGFSRELQSPWRRKEAAYHQGKSIAEPLIDCVLLLLSVETWKETFGMDIARHCIAKIMNKLVMSKYPGLFENIAILILTLPCSIDANQRNIPPAAETICTNLIVRYISVQDHLSKDHIKNKNHQSSILSLFAIPRLFHRCPSLSPVLHRVWKIAVLEICTMNAQELMEHLTEMSLSIDTITTMSAATALLGNIASAAAQSMVQEQTHIDTLLQQQQQQNTTPLLSSSLVADSTHDPRITHAVLQAQHMSISCMRAVSMLFSLLPMDKLVETHATASVNDGGRIDSKAQQKVLYKEENENHHHHIIDTDTTATTATNTTTTATTTAATDWMIKRKKSPNQQQQQLLDTLSPIDSHIIQQIHTFSDASLLNALLKSALPYEYMTIAKELNSNTQVNNPCTAYDQHVYTVSTFLTDILKLPGQRAKIIIAIALKCDVVARLWFYYFKPWLIHTKGTLPKYMPPSTFPLSGNSAPQACCDPGWMLPLCIFSESFSTSIMVSGDQGLYEKQHPLPLIELYNPDMPRAGVVPLLRAALWHTLWIEVSPATLPLPSSSSSSLSLSPILSASMSTSAAGKLSWPSSATALRSCVNSSAGRLMSQLHDRNGRRRFAPAETFYADALPAERFLSEISSGVLAGHDANDPGTSRGWGLLASAPFLVPFVDRARVFQRLISAERSQYRERESNFNAMAMMTGGGGDGHAHRQFVSVRRDRVLEDAYTRLGAAPPEDLRGRVRIEFISEYGVPEAGVDGGGLFKEFLEEVVKSGFDPGFGLFKATTDNKLYPNPHAVRAVPGALKLLEFLGRMVGKAMWEGILLELPLAPFFLKKFRGAVCDVDDLPTLDPQLSKSLLSLKDYPGDVIDLGLTFSVTDDVLGHPVELELVPGGKDKPVTASNAALFIHRVADFKLNTQLKEPTGAFLKGLHALIPREWVSMFNDRELQELLGGSENGSALDIADLQAHVQYAAGYSADHPVIRDFWEALGSFTPPQQANFLRFVTSCPRPPLLGFAYLEPPLTIQMASTSGIEDGSSGDVVERLPTAATCMNLLKLPPYRGGVSQVKDKLLYAVESHAGFELS